MKNEVILEGNVLNCYIDDQTGALIVKMAVCFDHHVGKHIIPDESVFKIIMTDEKAIKETDIRQGQYVRMTGYVRLDIKISKTEKKEGEKKNKHEYIHIYALKYEAL
jgi:hypothetical protein